MDGTGRTVYCFLFLGLKMEYGLADPRPKTAQKTKIASDSLAAGSMREKGSDQQLETQLKKKSMLLHPLTFLSTPLQSKYSKPSSDLSPVMRLMDLEIRYSTCV